MQNQVVSCEDWLKARREVDPAARSVLRHAVNTHHWTRGPADWLCLAAAPTFAIMALLASVLGGGPLDALCSSAHDASPLSMVLMYLLMSVFHSAPWLKLISSRP